MIRYRIGYLLINLGLKLFDDQYRTHTVIHNSILTGKIKAKRDLVLWKEDKL